jgi:hypothetical protein
MTYAKPVVVPLNHPIDAIQGQAKTCTHPDGTQLPVSTGAYEADE